MFNITEKDLTECIECCVTEQLNDWLADSSAEDIALMLCVARTHKAAQSNANSSPSTLR